MSMDNTMEQKGQHTPGPWFAVRNSAFWEVNPQQEYGDDHIPYTVADVCASAPENPDGGLQEANARLIAAAPDMLEVLQEILDATSYDHGGPNDLYAKAEKIIAKAKGTTL